MKKPPLKALIGLIILSIITITSSAQTLVNAGKQNEMFWQEVIGPNSATFLDPWDILIGPDDSLWITEAKGYKINRMAKDGSGTTMLLNLMPSEGAQAYAHPRPDRLASFGTAGWTRNYTPGAGTNPNKTPDPQGGMMGIAVHPEFKTNSAKRFVFVAYVYSFTGFAGGSSTLQQGAVFVTKLTRWTFNNATGLLDSPVSLCDSIPGSGDHNSGRMIIAPQNGVNYLYYACGDMGAGQFDNAQRDNKSQNQRSYEGKILRFNIDPDADADLFDRWIPNTNPFNTTSPAKQSAVWATGIRNNQGLAYARINNTDKLYGSSHGPYSDDEINILEQARNFGHPLVIGYQSDNNYQGCSAGTPGCTSTVPVITSESSNATGIGGSYKDPLFSAYAAANGPQATLRTVRNMYNNNTGSHYLDDPWPSEAWTGMDVYKDSKIPGYKYSLMVASLKWGRLVHLRMNATGDLISSQGGVDTSSLLQSQNRFRDVTFDANGTTMYVSMDRSPTSSGPSAQNPIVPGCAGCVQKFTFLGYKNNYHTGTSTIPTWIPIAPGTDNICEATNTVNISSANHNDTLWVPITDQNSNIVAEIKANGNQLGNVSAFVFKKTGALRETYEKALFLNKSITINVQNQPSTAVSIRLYVSTTDFNQIVGATNSLGAASGVTAISNMAIFKNSEATCYLNPYLKAPQQTALTVKSAFGTGGYVLGANVTSFSTFYFAPVGFTTLPLNLISFTGALQNGISHLDWKTSQELNVKNFVIERSIDGQNYTDIGTVAASGSINSTNTYKYDDKSSAMLGGLVYYRLKVKDTDGSFKYSSVVTIEIPYTAGKVTVAPNPATSTINVKIAAPIEGKAQWQLSDNTGRVVVQNSAVLRKGVTNIHINLSGFAPGIYYLNVKGAQLDQRVKVQKL